MDLLGEIRRWSRALTGPRKIRFTNYESLAVAQVEAPGVEGNRGLTRFMLGNSAAVTGIAPVTALPTTQAQWGIFNNEPIGGKTYYFEELGAFLTSGTPGVGGILLACIAQTPAPTGSNVAGCSVAPTSLAGNSAASVSEKSRAIVKSSPAAFTTPAAPTWFEVAEFVTLAAPAAFPAGNSAFNRLIKGGLSIPPQFWLGLAVVSPAGTTPLYAPMAKWQELATDNE